MADSASHKTILVADDSTGHRTLVEMLLSAHNYAVVSVADGHEALTYLQCHTPHLVIMDVNMPYMTGIEVCERVKRIARLRAVPVIIMTSLADPETVAAAEAAGADLLVNKPLSGKSIPDMLRQGLAAARQRLGTPDQTSGDSFSSSSLL